ncbi:MAG: NUDIX hydrolase [Parcubacteria group bacterium]|jgi:8-oxo-dGTP pyrophosphatase MutT (NUDIX family)
MDSKIIIASGPVIVEDNKVLLDLQGDDNFWKFCGGKTKEGEALKETAQRRAKEELGIKIEILDEKPFLIHTTKETTDGLVDVILVHYLAKRRGEITPGADIRECKWIPLSDLEKENLAPNILPTLKYFEFIAS